MGYSYQPCLLYVLWRRRAACPGAPHALYVRRTRTSLVPASGVPCITAYRGTTGLRMLRDWLHARDPAEWVGVPTTAHRQLIESTIRPISSSIALPCVYPPNTISTGGSFSPSGALAATTAPHATRTARRARLTLLMGPSYAAMVRSGGKLDRRPARRPRVAEGALYFKFPEYF